MMMQQPRQQLRRDRGLAQRNVRRAIRLGDLREDIVGLLRDGALAGLACIRARRCGRRLGA